MHDVIVELLRVQGRVRFVHAATMALVTSFFAERVAANLTSGARRHPLGFLFVSEPLGVNLILRYHFWPADWAMPHGQEGGRTHDHCYELNSLVVAGSLRQRTFQAVRDVDGGHDVLEVDYTHTPMSSALRRTGLRARLDEQTDEVFSPGTAYRLASGTVHHVEAVTLPAATLVLTVPIPGAPAPRVLVPCDQDAPGEFLRDRLDAAEVATAREAINRLILE